MTAPDNAALHGAISFYAASCYPTFERLGFDAAKEAADAAGEANSQYPCWQRDKKGQFPEFDLPHFGKRSSVFCIAVLCAFLVWTQKAAGNPLPDSPLLAAAEDGWKLWKMEVRV